MINGQLIQMYHVHPPNHAFLIKQCEHSSCIFGRTTVQILALANMTNVFVT